MTNVRRWSQEAETLRFLTHNIGFTDHEEEFNEQTKRFDEIDILIVLVCIMQIPENMGSSWLQGKIYRDEIWRFMYSWLGLSSKLGVHYLHRVSLAGSQGVGSHRSRDGVQPGQVTSPDKLPCTHTQVQFRETSKPSSHGFCRSTRRKPTHAQGKKEFEATDCKAIVQPTMLQQNIDCIKKKLKLRSFTILCRKWGPSQNWFLLQVSKHEHVYHDVTSLISKTFWRHLFIEIIRF